MLISKKEIESSHLIDYMLDKTYQLDNCGVYFTLNKIKTFESGGRVDFDTLSQRHPCLKEVPFNDDFTIDLQAGTYYIEFNERIALTPQIAGVFHSRKALIKAGAFIQTYMVNPSYTGFVSGILEVRNPHGIKITKHARLGKWVFLEVRNEISDTE